MIEHDEWNVFESKFWKPEPNTEHRVQFTDWSIAMVPFRDQPPKPKLCMKIVMIDGKEVQKEFQTGNRSLILQLRHAIDRAQEHDLRIIDVVMHRGLGHEYQVANMMLVNQLAKSVTSPVRKVYS